MKLPSNMFRFGAIVTGTALLLSAPLVHAAPLPVGLPVTVNNTPSNAVPVTGVVGVTSLPSVTINNSTPVNVRDAEGPARHPFQAKAEVQLGQGHIVAVSTLLTVPAHKLLVIETLDAQFGADTAGQAPGIQLFNIVGGVTGFHSIPMIMQQAVAGASLYVGSQPVRYYADAGTPVQVDMGRTSDAGNANFEINISGYLVDLP
jgi:hypothetical protein